MHRIAVLLALIVLGAQPATACSCGSATLEQSFAAAEAVFCGVVASIDQPVPEGDVWIEFTVTGCWKGVTQSGSVVTVRTEAGYGCTIPFCCFVGSEWTIWADDAGSDLFTNKCYRSHYGQPDGDEAAFLGPSICTHVAVEAETWGRIKATYR